MLLGMSIVIVQLTIDNSLRFALCCHSSSHDMSLETCIGSLKKNTIIKKKDEHRSYVFFIDSKSPQRIFNKNMLHPLVLWILKRYIFCSHFVVSN